MTLTYGGYDIAAMTGKYGVSVVPRTVEGPNPIDSIAGTHEPDPLAFKRDVVVQCWPLSPAQMNIVWTLESNAVDVPYQDLQYINGDVSITGKYRISVGQGDTVLNTTARKLYGGVTLTFTQR